MAELTNFGGSVQFDMSFDDPAQMAQMLNLIRGVDSKTEKPKKKAAWLKQNGFYKSKGEFGIKVLDDDRFAVLYIPKGAVVHVDIGPSGQQLGFMFWHGYPVDPEIRFAPGEKAKRKHRADEAYVVALCKLVYKQKNGKIENGYFQPYVYCDETLSLEIVLNGNSCKDKNFEYHTGAKLVIGTYDYNHDEACSEGIHYFTNAKETLDYAYDPADFVRWYMGNKDKIPKSLMFNLHGAELLEPWMDEQIERFKTGWGKDIYEAKSYEEDEDEADEKPDRGAFNELCDQIAAARRAIDKVVEAVDSIKPAERNDVGRYSYRNPARGTRCNCDSDDESDDRPP